MIFINIIGGLGNQMFQYACGRSLSLRSAQELRLVTDEFMHYKLHNGFQLQTAFGLTASIANPMELKNILGWRASPKLRRLLGHPALRLLTNRNWIGEHDFQYCHGLAAVKENCFLRGYWQSEAYFAEHSAQIRRDFTFKVQWDSEDSETKQRMKERPSASIHIRRGDYTHYKNRGIFAPCELSYYREAVHFMRERIPNLQLFVFSDDPDWAESNLSREFDSIMFVRHNIERCGFYDMRLMSQADHHIIANSSFSWWGAWLNPSPSKLVIAPAQWFINGTDDGNLVPANWIRL